MHWNVATNQVTTVAFDKAAKLIRSNGAPLREQADGTQRNLNDPRKLPRLRIAQLPERLRSIRPLRKKGLFAGLLSLCPKII
jgi:hypothetical protein